MMKSEPILVNGICSTRDDACLRRLVEFSGLNCRTMDVSTFAAELNRAEDHELCVLASATTIDEWCHKCQDPAAAMDKVCQKACSLFVYGFAPETPMYIAAGLSAGAISDVRRFTRTDLHYEVSPFEREITREFSGLSFSCVSSATEFGFMCSGNSGSTLPLISIEGMALFVLVPKNGCKSFLLACSAIADIDEAIQGNFDPNRYFSRLLPAAMFLKATFKSRCWHTKYRFANFVIDDPPLKPTYGYLNYRDLVSAMDKAGFASTIAFIPWNYKRTDKAVTQLFLERPDRLALCVHGCDHTAAEFATTDLATLNSRVQLASARMDSLHRQNGLPYSKAMVFPQGHFSTEALMALKSNNYAAALSSCMLPATSAANPPLRVSDLLEPAVTTYGGFPVFLRRHPVGLEQFAFDLFFEKPALVAEHHAYFKDGGERLAEFIARLNSLNTLRWSGLHEIMTNSYLECETSDDTAACRIYTNHHVIENQAERERTFIVTKYEMDGISIQNVLVDGQTTEFVIRGNVLEFTMRIASLSAREVKILYHNQLPSVEPRRALSSRGRVWTRRMLSEFRDNVLCRSDLLLASAHALQRGLSNRSPGPPDRPDRVSS